jgi:hypothetical protein
LGNAAQIKQFHMIFLCPLHLIIRQTLQPIKYSKNKLKF